MSSSPLIHFCLPPPLNGWSSIDHRLQLQSNHHHGGLVILNYFMWEECTFFPAKKVLPLNTMRGLSKIFESSGTVFSDSTRTLLEIPDLSDLCKCGDQDQRVMVHDCLNCRFLTGWFTFNEMQMKWLQVQVMLSIIKAPTCVSAIREKSIDSHDEGIFQDKKQIFMGFACA